MVFFFNSRFKTTRNFKPITVSDSQFFKYMWSTYKKQMGETKSYKLCNAENIFVFT